MESTTKNDLKRLGFALYPGCRTEAIEYAMNELGISLFEIISKFSDDDVLEAINTSCEYLGLYSDLKDEEDDNNDDDEED